MKCVHWLGQIDTSESAHAANAWQLLTMERLDSSDSCLLIRICWKVYSETRTKVSIHTEYLSSGGARILIFIVMGGRAVSPSVSNAWIQGGSARQHYIGI